MDPQDLLRIAERLASGAAGGRLGSPRVTELRRAVSAAYYAMFHTPAACCVEHLAGDDLAASHPSVWRQVYRALEHGHARNQCANSTGMRAFSYGVQDFGRHFVVLQTQRQSADYDPYANFLRMGVTELITETRRRIEGFNTVPRPDQRAFALYVLLRAR